MRLLHALPGIALSSEMLSLKAQLFLTRMHAHVTFDMKSKRFFAAGGAGDQGDAGSGDGGRCRREDRATLRRRNENENT